MALEKEKLQFEVIRANLEAESESGDVSKEFANKQLTLRLREAQENTRKLHSYIQSGPSFHFDPSSLSAPDNSQQRHDRLIELQEIMEEKKELEAQTRTEIRVLKSKLVSEARDPASSGQQSDYSERLADLNIAYDDILVSSSEHLGMNSSLMKKEREIKELEAQLLFLAKGGSDQEYQRLFKLLENEKRRLDEISFAQRDSEGYLAQLRNKKASLVSQLYGA